MKPILLAAVVLLCACHSKKPDTVYRMPSFMPRELTIRRSVFADMSALNNMYDWVNKQTVLCDSIIIDRNMIACYKSPFGVFKIGSVDSNGFVTITDAIPEKDSYLIDDSTGRRVTDSGGKMIIDTTHPWGHKPQIKTW
jgi:hypothetical protein